MAKSYRRLAEDLVQNQPSKSLEIGSRSDFNAPVVVDRTEIGFASDPRTGALYRVEATRHDKPWPGFGGDLTFAVNQYAKSGKMVGAFGFFFEPDAWRFLHSRDTFRVHVWSLEGHESTDVRTGLGIPDAYISR